MTIFTTDAQRGSGTGDYYWSEYRLEHSKVVKYKCHKRKFFNGGKSFWEEEQQVEAVWAVDDPNMPDWLRQYL